MVQYILLTACPILALENVIKMYSHSVDIWQDVDGGTGVILCSASLHFAGRPLDSNRKKRSEKKEIASFVC